MGALPRVIVRQTIETTTIWAGTAFIWWERRESDWPFSKIVIAIELQLRRQGELVI